VQGVLRRPQEALESYRRAAAIDDAYPNVLGNLGNVALDCDCIDEAIAAFERVLSRTPQDANIALARAIALYAARRFELAGPAYEYAVSLAPQSARHHWEYAHLLLMMGDYARGWEEYDARFAAGNQSNVWRYPYPFPLWQGEPLAGKTLLLHGEQGLGDEIMFGSIYPELIAEAGSVIICCQPHMVVLFRDSFPGVRVEPQLRADADAWTKRPADWLAGAPHVDYQSPFGSLGRWRRRSREAFPAHSGYLRTDPAKVAAWAQQLQGAGKADSAAAGSAAAAAPHSPPGASPRASGASARAPAAPRHLAGAQRRLRVGLCWAANPAIEDAIAARRSRKKSLTLQALESLFAVEGVDFVSLQTWEAAAQVAAATPATRGRIYDASAGLKDFADTAALMMNLDLIITVDTSVAHLAGALGRPVWIALPWQADWRWRSEGDTTEWYPSARLFRQSALNDWDSAIVQMRDALAAFAEGAARHAQSAPASSTLASSTPQQTLPLGAPA